MSGDPTEEIDSSSGDVSIETDEVTAAAITSSYKILGELDADNGVAVLGQNNAGNGTPIGVQGAVPNNASGYGLATPDAARVEGDIEATSGHTMSVDGTPTLRLGPTGTDGAGNAGAGNVVAGWSDNRVENDAVGATISGGGKEAGFIGNFNAARDNYATVGGGTSNVAGDSQSGAANAVYATIGGGYLNYATGEASTIGGGENSFAGGDYSTVGGGNDNSAEGDSATVGGGKYNTATSGNATTVAGGTSNTAKGVRASVGGGGPNKASENFATVSGGGGNRAEARASTIGGGTNNKALGELATISGGTQNEAQGVATVGGGNGNGATESWATVGGGKFNDARDRYATVGGGDSNDAWDPHATVAGGEDHDAHGTNSTIGGGWENRTGKSGTGKGFNATVPGGYQNTAQEDHSFAAGRQAKAIHAGAFVWNDSDINDLKSTGQDQFLIDADGGVGINTNSPVAQLHVLDSVSGSASPGNHVAFIENTASGSSDVLSLKINENDPLESGNNFMTFRSADGNIGAIEGTGSGGITLNTSSGDYAEYLPRLDPEEAIEPADVVGVVGGSITRRTADADRALVVSDRSIVAGNSPGTDPEDRQDHEVCAFVGQVPVRVRGPVESGDLIVPSGEDDGTARPVAPGAYAPDDGPLVGQAWESDDADGISEVTVAVGIEAGGANTATLARQRDRITDLEAENDALRERNAELERRLATVENHLGLDGPGGQQAPADD